MASSSRGLRGGSLRLGGGSLIGLQLGVSKPTTPPKWRSEWTPIWILLVLMSVLVLFAVIFAVAKQSVQNETVARQPER
jgi:hypothetical protein